LSGKRSASWRKDAKTTFTATLEHNPKAYIQLTLNGINSLILTNLLTALIFKANRDLAIRWIGSFGIDLISLPSKVLAADVVTASLEKNTGVTAINSFSPRSWYADPTRCRSMRPTAQFLASEEKAILIRKLASRKRNKPDECNSFKIHP
jgi:hypothetical protein